MVTRDVSASSTPGKTIIVTVLVTSIISILLLMCSCNATNPAHDENMAEIHLMQGEITILPDELFYYNIAGNELVAHSGDGRTLYLYNPKTEETKMIYDNDEAVFIGNSVANSHWIVWVNKDNIDATEALSWNITAYDLQNHETHVVDQGQFSYRYPAPDFINLAPTQLSLSDENKLLYFKNIPTGDDLVGSQVVYYDMELRSKKVLQETDNVREQWLYDGTVNGDIVVWSKLSQLNYDYSFRMSNYKYSDLYLFDCSTQTVEQLTSEEFYCSPAIFENNMVMLKMPLTRQGQRASNTEIALMDLRSRDIEIIVDGDSVQYQYDGLRTGDELYRCVPVINSKYVFWYNTGKHDHFVYDYHAKKMVQVIEIDLSDPNNHATITKMFDVGFIIYEYSGGEEKKFLFQEID